LRSRSEGERGRNENGWGSDLVVHIAPVASRWDAVAPVPFLPDAAAKAGVWVEAVATEDGDEVRWDITVTNGGDGVVTSIGLLVVAGLPIDQDSALHLPDRSGAVVDRPWEALAGGTHVLAYPVPASMQFAAFTAAGLTTAVHVEDPTMAYKHLVIDGAQRGLGVRLFPFVEPGQSWRAPTVVQQVTDGGWHAVADRYRRWFRSWAVAPDVSPQVRRFPIIDLDVVRARPIADPYITDVVEDMASGSYRASAARLADLRARGYDGVELGGWFGDGHDTTYPDYEPGPLMGTAEDLADLCAVVKDQGGLLALYLNARVANITNPTYLAHPEWAVRTMDGGPHIEHYGGEAFHTLCPAAPGWQEHLAGVVDTCMRVWHADAVQLDQVGAAPSMLCFDPSHGHTTPATAWAEGYEVMLRRLREVVRAAHPEGWLWVEGAWDGAAQFTDLAQGAFWPAMHATRAWPLLYRYTLPEHPVFGDARMGGVPFWCPTDVRRARVLFDALGDFFVGAAFGGDRGVRATGGDAYWFAADATVVVTVAADPRSTSGAVSVELDPAVIPVVAGAHLAGRAVVAAIDVDIVAQGDRICLSISVPPGEVDAVVLPSEGAE
jgi:hypothetical protein